MTDWHSHILPGVDDGSANLEESVQLLRLLSAQGINTVAATPHFNAGYDNPHSFIDRRDRAYRTLLSEYHEDAPRIILGAEVAYYPGVSNMAELEALCIGDTGYLLLEMPLARWSRYTQDEVLRLARSGRVTVVLAHAERYIPFRNASNIKELCANGVLVQANASFFVGKKTRRAALKLLREGRIHMLGSDCHNLDRRPPRIAQAIDVIESKSINRSKLKDYN